jgi:hypothetical protein
LRTTIKEYIVREGGCPMASLKFLVGWNMPQSNWSVRLGGAHYGEYLTKELALLDAIDAAGDARKEGHVASVWDADTSTSVF